MECKYQIFISSTYTDLVQERRDVVEQILNAHHFPIGMEMFEASDKKQWEVIQQTIDTSDIYILILGNRYGTTDAESGVSYTEKEYDYAVEKNKPILVFYSEDKEFERQVIALDYEVTTNSEVPTFKIETLRNIYAEHYDKNRGKIIAFRRKTLNTLSKKFTRNLEIDFTKEGVRKSDVKIDIYQSIKAKIDERPLGGWIRRIEGIGVTSIQNRLLMENPKLFDGATINNLEYARVLPNGQSLGSEASFAKIIETTESEFYIFTNAFKQFYFNEEAIDDSLQRGVKYKILLIDPDTENEHGINDHWVYYPEQGMSNRNRNKLIADLESTIDRIKLRQNNILKLSYPGTVEVKYYRKPVYFQMWMQDPSRAHGIAQINIAHFDGFKPHFRVSKDTSKRLFNFLKDEFTLYWNDAENIPL